MKLVQHIQGLFLTAVSLTLSTAYSPAIAQTQTCKWGLGYGSQEACETKEALAASRMAQAKTICYSGDSEVHWNKHDKSFNSADTLRIMRGAAEVAAQGYRFVFACEHSDLVIKLNADFLIESSVSINVTDADSGDTVFTETRAVQEEKNDLYRLALHFKDAHNEASRIAQEEAHAAVKAMEIAREQEREAQAAAQAAKADQQCAEEEASFRQNIISVATTRRDSALPLMTQDIVDHNQRCPHNVVVPEKVVAQYRAEAAAKEAAEQARVEQVRRDEERKKVLSAWQQELAAAPFVVPVAGQMRLDYQLPVPTGLYYIIPSDGNPDRCAFLAQEMKKLKGAKSAISLGVLECPRTGRQDYFVLKENDHFYLIQATDVLAETERVGTVKDKGTTVCFHGGGCEHVLAEIRLVPTDLPHDVQVPIPGPLTATYNSDGLSFEYPQNWRVSRKNGGAFIEVVPPEGHVGTWYTHGMFVRHYSPNPLLPPTLAGAFDRILAFYQKSGRVFDQKTPVTVGGREGLVAAYASSSPISGEERGRFILILDNGGGYYEFETFSPGPENETYRAVLDGVLNTVQFNTTLYSTDLYSGTIHNKTANKSTRLEVKIRTNEGKLSGCIGVVEPLYGSGPLKGLTKDGTVTFTVDGDKFNLIFRGKSENGKISGTYNVSPIDVGAVVAQEGEFSVEKTGSQSLFLQPCPTDAEVNANNR